MDFELCHKQYVRSIRYFSGSIVRHMPFASEALSFAVYRLRRNAETETELVTEKKCVAIAANSFSREKDVYSAGEGSSTNY